MPIKYSYVSPMEYGQTSVNNNSIDSHIMTEALYVLQEKKITNTYNKLIDLIEQAS